jgi:iron complex transport system substrate-binding protein
MIKFQIPNSKSQINSKFQIPICIWCLVLICYLVLGAWNFSYCSVDQQKARYISLAPATTEILFSLGLDEQIVGVSSYCNYPPQAQLKEKVGSFSSPSMEKILSLKPDIVFCTGLEQAPAVRELKNLHLKAYVSNPSNLDGLFKSIQDIGSLTHKEKEAGALINKMKSDIMEVKLAVSAIPQEKKQKVFVEIWSDPPTTAGEGSFIDELITLAGGINIAHDTRRPYSYFSAEEIIKRNPDCIIIGYMQEEAPAKAMERLMGWKDISAVKNNRVYNDINPDLFLRPGPRLTEGLKEIYKRLYKK